MERLEKQMNRYQRQVFRSKMEAPLLVCTLMAMQRYLCLVLAVVIIPISSLCYVPLTLTRLLYRMVFREKFALFRAGRVYKDRKVPVCGQQALSGGPP